MHAVTFAYPDNPTEQDRKSVTDFFTSLGHILPCKKCQDHWAKNLKSRPIQSHSRDALSNWLIDVHNVVNKQTGKPMHPPSLVADKYNAMRGTCRSEMRTTVDNVSHLLAAWFTSGALLLVVAGLLYYIMICRKR